MESVSEKLCHSLWGSEDCLWVSFPSVGNSGGILSIWRKSSSALLFSFTGDGFVGVCIEWGASRRICFMVNVYAKCDLVAKRRLWGALIATKTTLGDGNWCILGDFNSVASGDERCGVNPVVANSMEIREFVEFMEGMDLVDVPILGRRFTWFHPSGRAMSRIDRVLVSEDWLSLWGVSS
jgi:hypothetical protein